MSNENLVFTVDSALLREIGERLVESVHVALVELIKNAYDADATEVYVRFIKNPQGYGPTIEIEDNGIGMNHEEVRNYWMKIATTNKVKNNLSKLYGRRKTGEKGIGRFSCRRLGSKLELETIAKNKDKFEKTTATFDWNKFQPGLEVTKVISPGKMTEEDTGKTGTKLIISNQYKDEWKPRGYDYVKRQLSQLVVNRGQEVDGYKPDKGFNIMIDAEGTSMKTLDLRQDVLDAGWGTLTGNVNNKGEVIYKLNALDIGNKTIKGDREYPELKGIHFKIGIIPDRKQDWRNEKILSLHNVREILKEWGGVQVSLNQFRVYPYGDDDWLEISKDKARAKGSAKKDELLKFAKRLKILKPSRSLLSMFSMRSYLGTVEIEGNLTGFTPKANREGFIYTPEVDALKNVVRYGIDWSAIYQGSTHTSDKIVR